MGGNIFYGFISAVAFATILAVVVGLAISGAGAISHDLYTNVIKNGKVEHKKEMKITKFATIGIGILAILLGIVFEKQNVAFTVGKTLLQKEPFGVVLSVLSLFLLL